MLVTSIFIYEGDIRGICEETLPYPSGPRRVLDSKVYFCAMCGRDWARLVRTAEGPGSNLLHQCYSASHIPCIGCGLKDSCRETLRAGDLLAICQKPQGTGGTYTTPPQEMVDQHMRNMIANPKREASLTPRDVEKSILYRYPTDNLTSTLEAEDPLASLNAVLYGDSK